MESGKILRNSQIIILGICIAVATIVASIILSQGALRIIKFNKEIINVTGSAQKQIRSDYIIWRCGFTRREADLPAAYKKLQADLKKIQEYLLGKEINEREFYLSPIETTKIYKKTKEGKETNDIESYELGQGIEIRSNDVTKVDAVSREITELINEGIQLVSASPQYFYTDLDKLKIEMLSKATENAKLRAESMAKSTRNKVGFIRSAKMGVFQITPVTSTDVSDWGENDTSSLDKKVMAVVSASFGIE